MHYYLRSEKVLILLVLLDGILPIHLLEAWILGFTQSSPSRRPNIIKAPHLLPILDSTSDPFLHSNRWFISQPLFSLFTGKVSISGKQGNSKYCKGRIEVDDGFQHPDKEIDYISQKEGHWEWYAIPHGVLIAQPCPEGFREIPKEHGLIVCDDKYLRRDVYLL